MDWEEIIASSLRTQLKHAKESREIFYMASYLLYVMSASNIFVNMNLS